MSQHLLLLVTSGCKLGKFRFFLLQRVHAQFKNQLKSLWGVNPLPQNTMYLGVPQFFFLTRKDFNYVKEKLEARTSSWKCKALSWQGQATLIKSVALAIPTYIMAVCKFPKGLCEEMDSMLKCFWWGANQESSQYFTPTAWSKLCTPKMKEGWVLEALVT